MNLHFDIAHYDTVNMIVIEGDKLFLNDQRSVRKYVMGGIDKDTEEKKKQTTIQAATQRKMKEEKRKQRITETARCAVAALPS